MKAQSHQPFMPANTPVTKTLISAAHRAERANYLRQHRQATLTQMPANTVHAKSLVQFDSAGLTTADISEVGDNYIMGNAPQTAIVKRGDPLPAGNWFIASQKFVDDYKEYIADQAGLIGPWAIIAYWGG